MISQLEKDFISTPLKSLEVAQLIVLDWYDGPVTGFCKMSTPAYCFYFEAFAEKHTSDGIDERLFRLKEISPTNFQKIVDLLSAELGLPNKPIWIPKWQFSDESVKTSIESFIDSLIRHSNRSNIIFHTHNMLTILGIWRKR